jgi:hypothetical protein
LAASIDSKRSTRRVFWPFRGIYRGTTTAAFGLFSESAGQEGDTASLYGLRIFLRTRPMTTVIAIAATFIVAGLAIFWRQRTRRNNPAKSLQGAVAAGMAIDEDGNIHAGLTYAAMLARQDISGVRFDGAAAEFFQLVRLISQGPSSLDEIRILIEKGFQPIVRPDGLVYVPCVENEHLSVPGEIALELEDLELLEEQRITG